MAATAHGAKDLAAISLVRALLARDTQACVLIIDQNSGPDLDFALAGLTVKALLAADGYSVAKVLAVLDGWIDTCARNGRL